ncbi:hypothetical protein SNOG_11741 [Parastagonospora nodorum SN15]|uniref:Beta-xylanase n=1 Tax=Phaeosphaeria nodorum (strain SN15 / ATCC MYA-4574 / FGSC 10173) TaxID=321614 RepID=Q0U923_PHANO|nr:hypothetical protein SNOG_11741 [Parastagonospora nodorum SN15]EAT80785.2 hypothetical protein SNOG_11741 [Parastagonospora nodorum SN15]
MKASLALTLLPLIAATPTPSKREPESAPGLGDLAKNAGLEYFGTAIDNVVLNNTQYTNIAFNRSEFKKWMHIEPARNVFNYTLGDQVMVPAKSAGQIRRCHTFVWHSPIARLVNEAFEEDGSYRKDVWLDTIGPEYIEHAFRWARQYTNPGTKLYYNDYGIERVNNKSLAVQKMVKDFIARGVPIDGVGLQAHFTVGRAPTYDEVRNSQALFSSLGLDTALTELDVRIALPANATTEAIQAEVYANATRACVDEKKCVGVTVWDFWDPVSLGTVGIPWEWRRVSLEGEFRAQAGIL